MSRQREEHTVAVNLLQRMAAVLERHDPALLKGALQAAGVPPAVLSRRSDRRDNGTEIELSQLERAQRYATARCPGLVLLFYETTQLSDIGLIGYAIASSRTIRRALEIDTQYHGVTATRYDLTLLETRRHLIVRQLPFIEHLGDQVELGEEQLGIVRILRSTLSDQVDQSEIEATFAYAAPGHRATYERLFPGPCVFEAEHTEIRIPKRWAELPVRTANETASILCSSMCERLLGLPAARQTTSGRVRHLLVGRIEGKFPSLEEAAAELRLSVSQLRKRLYRENTSYKALVLEVRMTLARHYLESTALSVQEIAYLLDYSQPPPFSRAFKAYHGYPPSRAERCMRHTPSASGRLEG